MESVSHNRLEIGHCWGKFIISPRFSIQHLHFQILLSLLPIYFVKPPPQSFPYSPPEVQLFFTNVLNTWTQVHNRRDALHLSTALVFVNVFAIIMTIALIYIEKNRLKARLFCCSSIILSKKLLEKPCHHKRTPILFETNSAADYYDCYFRHDHTYGMTFFYKYYISINIYFLDFLVYIARLQRINNNHWQGSSRASSLRAVCGISSLSFSIPNLNKFGRSVNLDSDSRSISRSNHFILRKNCSKGKKKPVVSLNPKIFPT